MARYFNSKVRERKFEVGDLVLRQTFQNTKEPGAWVLGYSWEGPYQVTEALGSRVYRLADLVGTPKKYPWNTIPLKKYFQ